MGWMKAGKNQVWGDEPQDIMDEAIEKCIKVFERVWKRKPTMKELENHFRMSAETALEDEE